MIFIDTYNLAFQAKSGGVRIKAESIYTILKENQLNVKYFDKYTDKVTKEDILFVISPEFEHYSLIKYAQKVGCRIVVASVKTMDCILKKYISYYLGWIRIKLLEFYVGEILRAADLVISETKKEKNFIEKVYKVSSEKVEVIPNGVTDYLNFEYSDRIFQYTNNKNYVLCVGRFDDNKNQINLIKAMKNSEVPIVFVGGATIESIEYYNECKVNANDHMYFLEWLDHFDPLLVSAYQNAKVLVLPSKYEIFGNALIEGGVAGANLVATSSLPLREWGVEDLCESMDVDNIMDIRDKIEKSYYQKRNPNIRRYFKDRFGWETIGRKLVELLNEN